MHLGSEEEMPELVRDGASDHRPEVDRSESEQASLSSGARLPTTRQCRHVVSSPASSNNRWTVLDAVRAAWSDTPYVL
jgi:hypothetical protein